MTETTDYREPETVGGATLYLGDAMKLLWGGSPATVD